MSKPAKKAKTLPLEDRIIDAALNLFAELGYSQVQLTDIATAANCDRGELRSVLSSKSDVLRLILSRVDHEVLSAQLEDLDPEETVRDRLFDMLMQRLDALLPYRERLAPLVDGLKRDPIAAFSHAIQGELAISWYLEAAGTSTRGLKGIARIKGLYLLWLTCLRTWVKDDTDDLAKTMAHLDKLLARAENAANWLENCGPSNRVNEAPLGGTDPGAVDA